MYVCICNAVTDHQIRHAAKNGIRTLQELGEQLDVATCCGDCADCARGILAAAHGADRRGGREVRSAGRAA